MLRSSTNGFPQVYSASYAPYVKRIKRFKNYFNKNSKFPLFRIYPRRGLYVCLLCRDICGSAELNRQSAWFLGDLSERYMQ